MTTTATTKTKPLISVIVPVYNTKKQYLLECFDSIDTQTYANVEAIIVDDGSSDETAVLLDEYVNDRPGWTVFHIENGGVSNARNRGIQEANGEYILFVDSDDAIDPLTVESCVDEAVRLDADVVCYGLEQRDETLRRIDYVQDYTQLDVPSKPFTIYDMNASGVFVFEQLHPQPVTKIIKKDLLRNSSIHFPSDIKIGEDQVFSFLVYLNAKRISVVDKPFYKYRIFSESSMGGAYRYPTDVIRAFYLIKGYLEENKLLGRWSDRYIDFIISNIKYNKWCYGDKYDAIDELFVAGNNLIDSIDADAINKRLDDTNETVVGLALAKQDIMLLREYYKQIVVREQKHSKNENENQSGDDETHTQIEERAPGIKQSAEYLKRAIKQKIGRLLQ